MLKRKNNCDVRAIHRVYDECVQCFRTGVDRLLCRSVSYAKTRETLVNIGEHKIGWRDVWCITPRKSLLD
jgi:hypothetical protein